MKRSSFWSFLVLLLCFALPANAYDKSPQEIDLSKSQQIKNLKELVSQIESQSSYRFSYVKGLIDNVPVQVSEMKKDIDGILQEALNGTGLAYVIKAKDIILMKTSPQPKVQGNNSSIKTIKGTVLDAETNEPIIGAQIWLKETPDGTVTNIDGEFQLKVKGGVGILIISYIGYKSQEIAINGNQPIVCKLKPDTKVLDEVVVVGYGTQKKESVVGSIASVKVDDLKAPVSKLSNNLGGQLAGVITLQKNNEPGASTEFWIRGISTFGASKKPLVLVDGIERDMDLVNPEDIQSFSVLKDAAATAIYGVRGANGVILITTRTGEEGKPKISFRVEAGMLGPTKRPKMVNSMQFAEMYNEASRSANRKEPYSAETIEKYRTGEDPDLFPNINWMDELYKDYAFSERVNLGVSGGGNIAKYYISGAFYNEGGMFKSDSMNQYDTSTYFKRYNFRSNVDVKLHRTTTLNVNLSTVFEKLNGSGSNSDTSGAGATSIWKYAFITSPNAFPVRYSDGKFSGPSTSEGFNPYNLLTQSGYYERFWNNAQSLIGLTQDLSELITPGLTANVKISFDAQNYNWIKRSKQVPTYVANGRDEEGNITYTQGNIGQENLDYSKGNTGYTTTYIEASVNYNRTFGKHSVGALFLYNQKQKNKTGVEKAEDALPYRHQGIAGRLTYAYDNRYFIEGNFGYNGSENFSPGRRFGFFPSIAAGWLVSSEKFWEPISHVVDMFKIKGSYGEVGSDQIGARRFIYNPTIVDSGSYDFGENAHTEKGVRMGDWANPNVGWERAQKMNAGVEVSFFNSLKIQVDYFTEHRDGIFLERNSLPLYLGITTKPYVNVGTMKNHGIDASLEYNQKVGQVRLSGKANFTYAHNTITDNDEPDWKYPYLNRRNQMLWQQYGLVDAGLFESQADIDSWPKQTFGEVKPGDIKYVDINGDGQIDKNDEKPIGWAGVPEIVYGGGLSAAWKGFDISVFFQGVAHVTLQQNTTNSNADPCSAIQAFRGRNMVESGVYEDIYYNHWSENNPNPNAKYPRLSIGSNENNHRNSTFWLKDMSFLRLKNVEIGYNFPSKWIDPMRLSGLRLYFSGVNLLTFSKFKLWDPEVMQAQGANYPANRIFNVGININF